VDEDEDDLDLPEPEPGERRLNIHLDPSDIAGVYANFANISFSRYEFTLTFARIEHEVEEGDVPGAVVARVVLGYGIRDYDSGFVLLRRSVFDRVTIIPRGYGEYFIEFIYNACRKGLKVGELGYYFRDRDEGQSKSFPSVWGFLRTGMHYAVRIVLARLRRID